MKALIASIALAAVSLSVVAHTPAELKKYHSHRYVVKQQPSGFEGIPNKGVKTVHGTVYTKLYNLCQEDGYIKTMNNVRMCAEWGPKPVRCDDGFGTCYDNDERVCNRYERVPGESPISYTRKVCANISEARRLGWRGDRDDFKDDYPNCSAFKQINMKSKTSYKFTVAKKSIIATDSEVRRFGGKLIEKFTYTIPTCN